MFTRNLYSKYIKGTGEGAIVQNVKLFLCVMTRAVLKGVATDCTKVYISTRVLKHAYDKRPAEEFDFLLDNVHAVVKYPDLIYKNRGGKRGDLGFVKTVKNNKYFCSVEQIYNPDGASSHWEIATFFRLRKESYLNSYSLLWEWKGGKPSS